MCLAQHKLHRLDKTLHKLACTSLYRPVLERRGRILDLLWAIAVLQSPVRRTIVPPHKFRSKIRSQMVRREWCSGSHQSNEKVSASNCNKQKQVSELLNILWCFWVCKKYLNYKYCMNIPKVLKLPVNFMFYVVYCLIFSSKLFECTKVSEL